MRQYLFLAAALSGPVLAIAQPAPRDTVAMSMDLPLEVGAPPRYDDGSIVITTLHVPLSSMQNMRGGCSHAPGEITVGCSIHNGMLCTIYLPLEVDAAIVAKIAAHEHRHCLGQEHVEERTSSGQKILRWLP